MTNWFGRLLVVAIAVVVAVLLLAWAVTWISSSYDRTLSMAQVSSVQSRG